MTEPTIIRATLLLLTAALVALAARRLHLPYTIGLVVTGIALAVVHIGNGASLTRDLIFDALLPPLLFEAALTISWRALRREMGPIIILSTLGVAIAALVVTVGMTGLAHWPWAAALVFGTLIAATDPVGVLALFHESGISGRLRLIVEAESLFNDGIAVVCFALALSVAMGTSWTLGGAVANFMAVALGGIAVGAACGGAAILLAGRTTDHLVETTLTTVAAYGSFLLADHWHLSGVLATVVAGMLMGNVGGLRSDGQQILSQRGREVVLAFWDFAAFVANSLIFLLIGLRVAHIAFAALGPKALALALFFVLAGRAFSVYPLCALFARSRLRVSLAEQHVLFWGSPRGAVGLALALSLPASLPYQKQIEIATFGVVAFSVIVQGITLPPLLRRLHLTPQKG